MIAGIETCTGSAPTGWDDLVRRLGGTVFHSTLWAEYQRSTRGVEPIYVLARDASGRECAGTLALFRRSSRPLLSLVVRGLLLPSHPFTHEGDPATASDLVDHCERLARSRGCGSIRMDSFMSGQSPFLPTEHGYAETQRLEFCVDLSRDAASLWQGIRKDQREKIRRLGREGVIVDVGTTPEDLLALRSARETTHARRSERGQGYELSGDDLYENLFTYLVKQGAARLFVARSRGEVIAALFFVTFNGRAYSVFSGSTEAGYKLGGQSGLFWTAVETFKAEGFTELNRGGVPASAAVESDPLHGIYLFKLRLGTVPQVCRSGEKILSPLRHRLARLRRRLRGPR